MYILTREHFINLNHYANFYVHGNTLNFVYAKTLNNDDLDFSIEINEILSTELRNAIKLGLLTKKILVDITKFEI